jgi:hypothetical protein
MTCPHIYGGAVLMWRSPHVPCSYFKLVYASFRDLPQILWELDVAYIMYINSSKAPRSLVCAGTCKPHSWRGRCNARNWMYSFFPNDALQQWHKLLAKVKCSNVGSFKFFSLLQTQERGLFPTFKSNIQIPKTNKMPNNLLGPDFGLCQSRPLQQLHCWRPSPT